MFGENHSVPREGTSLYTSVMKRFVGKVWGRLGVNHQTQNPETKNHVEFEEHEPEDEERQIRADQDRFELV